MDEVELARLRQGDRAMWTADGHNDEAVAIIMEQPCLLAVGTRRG